MLAELRAPVDVRKGLEQLREEAVQGAGQWVAGGRRAGRDDRTARTAPGCHEFGEHHHPGVAIDPGAAGGIASNFTVLHLTDPEIDPPLGYFDGPLGGYLISDPGDVAAMVHMFDDLRESALDVVGSAKLLAAILDEYRRKAALMSDQSIAAWRMSSFSNGTGACVEVALLDDGRTAVRNSNHPDAGIVLFTRAEMDAWIKGVKAGEFDDLT